MAIAEVITSHEAREELPAALKRFRAQGALAAPVIFGAYRKAEGVVIPFKLYEELLPLIEDLEIAQIIRSRQDEPRPLSELAEQLGLDPAEYE